MFRKLSLLPVFAASISPPLGFNPCNGFNCHMSELGETTLRSIAVAIATNGLRDAGYTLFSLDDGYQGPRSANGTLTANATAFPSGTLAPLASFVRALGLSLGAYTDRGQLTCEKMSGSFGHEADDARTLAAWGVSYLKEDSCNASEIEADRRAEYGRMAVAANASGLFLSVCGWSPTYAAFAALDPPIGGSWRLGPDAGPWPRFLLGLEAAGSASAVIGLGEGWPDLDMLSSNTGATQELFRLSAVAIVGSPLLLSWDVRNATASDLPLEVYLNPEMIAIHQDERPPLPQPYYFRVRGGPATAAAGVTPPAAGLPCASPAAQWRYAPVVGGSGGGTLQSLGAPGFCLSAWDLIPGGSCRNPINAYLLPCANVSSSVGCPASAFEWVPSLNGTLAVAFQPTSSDRLETNPFPGSLLTASGAPGALFLQPPRTGADASTQVWRTGATRGGPAATVTLEAADGTCLGAAPPADDNVWARLLGYGDVALLLVNLRADVAAAVACDTSCFADIEAAVHHVPSGGWAVRDVHARENRGVTRNYMSPLLEADGGSVLLRLTPVS